MSQYTKENSLLIIGISGVTCGGKTTAATQLKDDLPNTTIFSQDDYFLSEDDPRHVWIPELNHINYDIITSLDMEKMHKDILDFIKDHNFERVSHMEKIVTNTTQCTDVMEMVSDKMKKSKLNLLVIEGFSIFNYKPMLNLFHLKYYFTLDKDECFKRRIKREYEPPDCPGYFENCVWLEYLNLLNEVIGTVKDVKYFDGNGKNSVERIAKDILHYV